MFQTDDYLQHRGYQKIRYILKLAGMYRSDVATILDLDLDFVGKVLGTGVVLTPQDQDLIDSRFYNFLILVDYLLNLANYDVRGFKKHWIDVSVFDDARVKPPWYDLGLKRYLERNKSQGLEACIQWIKNF